MGSLAAGGLQYGSVEGGVGVASGCALLFGGPGGLRVEGISKGIEHH